MCIRDSYLPIPAGEHALETRIGEAPLQSHMLLRIDFGRCDQTVEIEKQAVIEAFLHRPAENARQHKAADDQAQHAPNRRAGNEPIGERIAAWNDADQFASPTALGSSKR